jgi:hypothetical protein
MSSLELSQIERRLETGSGRCKPLRGEAAWAGSSRGHGGIIDDREALGESRAVDDTAARSPYLPPQARRDCMGTEPAKLRVIITGATGMVGEGVLFECLENPSVERVLIVNRRPYAGATHPRTEECVVPDFMDLASVRQRLIGYDACFYCAGVSSRGMSEVDYSHITYDIPVYFARTLLGLNPQMVFVHVSGSLTDSTEKGRIMWARVKGRAENALLQMPFKKVYNFRPGFMKPIPGQQNIKAYYKAVGGLYPLMRVLFPNQVSTMQEVGQAMVNSVTRGYPKVVLEVADIKMLAKG